MLLADRPSVKGSNDLLRSSPDRGVRSQVPPDNGAARVEQKFSGPRDVFTFRSGGVMKQVVLTNRLGLRIGQKRECIPHFNPVTLTHLRWIHADGNQSNAALVELGQMFLKTPQLGVT